MPIRWSARRVSENLDELERLLKEVEPKLGECVAKASETARIEATRGYIPKEALAKDQVEFDRLVRYFNGECQAEKRNPERADSYGVDYGQANTSPGNGGGSKRCAGGKTSRKEGHF